MAAITLTGNQEKYVFSVVNKNSNLPAISGFYIVIKSSDKYGIRDREFLSFGYSKNFSQEKTAIAKLAKDFTHIYLMPDFERNPTSVLQDIETAGFMNKDKEAEQAVA